MLMTKSTLLQTVKAFASYSLFILIKQKCLRQRVLFSFFFSCISFSHWYSTTDCAGHSRITIRITVSDHRLLPSIWSWRDNCSFFRTEPEGNVNHCTDTVHSGSCTLFDLQLVFTRIDSRDKKIMDQSWHSIHSNGCKYVCKIWHRNKDNLIPRS